MSASLVFCFVLLSLGQSRRVQNTPNIVYEDDIWATDQNNTEYELGLDNLLSPENVQFNEQTDQIVQAHRDQKIDAKLRFYHDSFDNYTELEFHEVDKILSTSWYDPNKTTIIFTPGFTGHPKGVAVTAVMTAYLEQGKSNVALLNWERMAAAVLPNYGNSYLNWAAPNSIKLGNEFTDVLIKLSEAGLDLNKLHLIGHSLGAHLFGITGYRMAEKGINLQWITGMDPAKVGFDRKPFSMRISPKSARFVVIVHSDPNKYGSRKESGFVDFWPNYRNGPVIQPGCPLQPYPRFSPEDLCNHHRSWQLWIDALKHPGILLGSWAKNFRSWKNYSEQERKAVVLELGEFNPKAVPGNYYFTTTDVSPYGLGVNGL